MNPLRIATARAALVLLLGAFAVTGTLAGCSSSPTTSSDSAGSSGASASPGAAGTAGTAGTAGAAGSPTGAGPQGAAGGRRLMARALASLGLTDDQKRQIRAIMADARAKSAGADPETRRANYRAAFEKVTTVLTPDQQARFKAKMAELRREREQGMAPQS